MIAQRVIAALAATLAASSLAACESTQDTSSRMAKQAKNVAKESGVTIGRENASITVTGSAVVHDANGTAAVVLLRNKGGAQANVPIGIALSDAKGRKLYSNDLAGLDKSLTSIAAVAPRTSTFWVNNQIQAASAPKRASAKVGTSPAAGPGALPRMELTKVVYERDSDGVYARGVVTNRSKLPQLRLVVSCISTKGSKVLAAGRAIIDRLAPAPTPKPVTFRVYFIGDPKGGTLTCTAPPTVLPGGSS